MGKESSDGGKVLIQGVDYNLPDPDDNPYAQARKIAGEQRQRKVNGSAGSSNMTGGLGGPRSSFNYPDQREALAKQRYRRRG